MIVPFLIDNSIWYPGRQDACRATCESTQERAADSARTKRASLRHFYKVVGFQQVVRFFIILDRALIDSDYFLLHRARFLAVYPYVRHLRFFSSSAHHRQRQTQR